MSESWEEHSTAGGRVRAVALSTPRPRTASWVADEAGVAHATAEKYIRRMVESRELRVLDGEPTRYEPDPVTEYVNQVRDLVDEHTEEELAAGITRLKDRIREYEREYGVESPSELRASLADRGLTSAEERERRETAADWEHAERRLDLLADAVEFYDRFSDRRAAAPGD